jgi:hypothetical protein
MQRFERGRTFFLALMSMSLLLSLALLPTACGDKTAGTESTSSSLAAMSSSTESSVVPSSQTTTAAPASTVTSGTQPTTGDTATSTSAGPTTSAGVSGPSTTAAGGTATTAKPTTTTAKPTTTTAAPTTTTAPKGPVALTVTGPSGTKELSMAELKAMAATSGYGGWKNQLGNITGPNAYKGVSLRSLMDLVGGGGSVTVIASDGYSVTISSAEAGGAVITYDPATGDEVAGVTVKAIVAYAKDGGALSSSDGPLRVAFVSSESNQVTYSEKWVKQVVELRVN